MRFPLTHERRRGLGIGVFEELWSPPLSDKQKKSSVRKNLYTTLLHAFYDKLFLLL